MVTVAKLPKGRIDLTRKVLLELKQVYIVSFAVTKRRYFASDIFELKAVYLPGRLEQVLFLFLKT